MKTNVHFFITSLSILLRMRNVLDVMCRGNQNTRFVLNNFFSDNRVISVIMWKDILQRCRPQMVIQYGACALHAG